MCRTEKQKTTGTDIPVVHAQDQPAETNGTTATRPASPRPCRQCARTPEASRPLGLLKWPAITLSAIVLVALLCRCDQTQISTGPGSAGTVEPVEPTEPPHAVSEVRVLLCWRSGSAQLSTTGGYLVTVDGRPVAKSAAAMPSLRVDYRNGVWIIGGSGFPGRRAAITPAAGAMIRLGANYYRGSMHLIADGADAFRAVNHLPLESYLAGVLPKELYPDWAPATYEALAVAARTFALYHCLAAKPDSDYDLGDNQGSQCYGGYSAETPKSRAAVNATRGVVLSYGQPGRERIFLAQYSASCGGQVNGAYVIRNAKRIPPLEGGQVCTDCAGCSHYRWPAVRIAKSDILRALAARYDKARQLPRLDRIEVVSAAPNGRAVWIDAVGGNQRVRIRAEDLRLALLSDGPPPHAASTP